MRLPRMQLTIRRMMIAVAVVGVAFSIPVALRRRSEAFTRISQSHFRAANALIFAACRPGTVIFWHIQLGQKYQAAASRPWLPVESDPPKPE
ncbi:MAG: hypothetical protein ACLQIB_24625 [Isosphaeraceae bacterium]